MANSKKSKAKAAVKPKAAKAPVKVAKTIKAKAKQPANKQIAKKENNKPKKVDLKTKATPKVTQKKVEVVAVVTKTAVPTKKQASGKGSRGGSKAFTKSANHCRETTCDLSATTKGYCRLHYIKNWKRSQQKELILKEKKLNLYIEELISKYPDKYIEAIRQDLNSEKDFAKVITDMEIEEDVEDFIDAENEAIENVLESGRKVEAGFDDDDDAF